MPFKGENSCFNFKKKAKSIKIKKKQKNKKTGGFRAK